MSDHVICNKEDDINEMKSDIKLLLPLLKSMERLSLSINGNGKRGYFEMTRLVYEWMMEKKKDKHDIGMLVYRTVLGIFIAFIALKLGLK